MPVYISLLRGINVGGNKKIKMAELKTLYEALGFSRVQTLLQSGNALFEGPEADPETLAAQIEAGIERQFGFHASVIMRTAEEWQGVIARHPFSAEQLSDPQKLLITFLQQEPAAAALETLRQAHSGPETIHNSGRELYIHYPEGMGRSKLDHSLIERKLKITGSGRNWNTVSKLAALAGVM